MSRRAILGLVVALASLAGTAEAAKVKVAALPLAATNVPPEAARAVEAALYAEVGADPRVELITDRDIGNLIAHEKQKELLGCADDTSCITELGGALGAAMLLTGNVARLGGAYVVAAQLVDVRRATVLRRASRQVEDATELLEAGREVARELEVAGRPDGWWTWGLRAGFGGQLGILGIGVQYRWKQVAFGLGTGRYALTGGATWVPFAGTTPYVEAHVAWSERGLLGPVSKPGVGAGVSAGVDWHPFAHLSVKAGLGLAWNPATWEAGAPRPLFFDLAVGPVF